VILFGKRTRGITESMMIYLVVNTSIQVFGILWGGVTGLYISVTALTIGILSQTTWLGIRGKPILSSLKERDQQVATQ